MSDDAHSQGRYAALVATYGVVAFQVAFGRDPAWTWFWAATGVAVALLVGTVAVALWPYRARLLELALRRRR